MLVWNQEYRTGVPMFDAEHLVLVSLINQIEVIIENDRSKEAVQDVINALINFIEIHFQNEEKVMRKYGVPDYDDHKDHHGKFAQQVIQAATSYRNTGEEETLRQLHKCAHDWMQEHLTRGDDKRLVEFLNEKNVVIEGLSLSPVW